MTYRYILATYLASCSLYFPNQPPSENHSKQCWCYAWYWLMTGGRVRVWSVCTVRLAVDITTQWQINWHTVSDGMADILCLMYCQLFSITVIHWQHKCCVAWELRNDVTFICFMGGSRGQLPLCSSPATPDTQTLTK